MLLGLTLLLSRTLLRTPVYFVDGPRIVQSIRTGTYTIQSPGYWLFAHLGGLFIDPAFGLTFWNILFSTLGPVALFAYCRLCALPRRIAVSAALAYGSVYFAWFAGDIHSSYASQLLFPPLALYCFERYRMARRWTWLAAWALAVSIGWGLRPSDGVFLLPLWMFLLFRIKCDGRHLALATAILCACFLGWYIHTNRALVSMQRLGAGATFLMSMHNSSLLLLGFKPQALANLVRATVPTTIAFWPLLPALWLGWKDGRYRTFFLLWVLPGTLFLALCYIADPMYLLFCSAAWILLAAFAPQQRLAFGCLLACCMFNVTLFLAARPIHGDTTADRIVNFYVVKYCRYGLDHRWSSTIGRGAQVPY